MSAKKPTLPKVLYVKMEPVDRGESYFPIADADVTGLIDDYEPVRYGIYHLVRIQTAQQFVKVVGEEKVKASK